MNNLANFLHRLASSRLGQAAFVIVIATLVLRFPWIITSWTDEKLSTWVFQTADAIRDLALPILLLFMKGFTETGGSRPLTHEAESRVP
jgi:hypothetical protein